MIKFLTTLSLPKFLLIGFYIIFWGLIIRANLHRIGSFAFFDEYSTYVTGFFMLKGRTLFDEIFLNHQLLLSNISYCLQLLLQQESFYSLAIQHRITVLVFSLISSLFLVLRFKYIGIAFSIFFELTKFYLFGSLFLAESFIVYPLAYMIGLIILSIDKKQFIRNYDLILSAIITWFVFFIREPYVPLVLFMFGVILYLYKEWRIRIFALSIVGILSTITLLQIPQNEYFYQLITINANTVGGEELANNNVLGIGLLKIFFYPIYIFISGEQNFFRILLVLLSVVFLPMFVWLIYNKRKYKIALVMFISLGLANIRYIEPGQIYFAAFHMLPWMSIFLMSIFCLFYFYYHEVSFKRSGIILSILSTVILIGIFHKDSFILQRVDKESEFNDNYIRFRTSGEVIKRLSVPDDKLFVDLSDSLVHYYSGLDSSYKYAFFYPVMTGDDVFLSERDKMFKNTPPEFYYYYCYEGRPSTLDLPKNILDKYIHLKQEDIGACLFVREDVFRRQSKEKIESFKEFGYTLD